MTAKKKIRVKIEECHNLDGYPIEKVITNLQQSEASCIAQGFENIELKRHNGYDNYDEYWLTGIREETNEEFSKRLEEEKKQVEYQRKQYENLKKQFEK